MPAMNNRRTTQRRRRHRSTQRGAAPAAAPVLLVLLVLALMGAAHAQPGRTLTLHYQERPPYSHTGADGQPQGLLVAPAMRACQRAQLACSWMKTPSQRQLGLVQSGQGMDCGLGWFRNAEREALGRFSAALYQDQPFMALTRRDAPWDRQRPLPALLADASRPLLVKDGYSYGALLDGLIAQHAGTVRRTSTESVQMARMVEAGRAAWMIIAPEEADALLADMGAAGAALHLQPLPGVPAGQTRHLYCSKAVPEALLERLNRALAER